VKQPGAHTHPPNPQLCRPGIGSNASCSLAESQMTAIPTPNGDFETGDGTNWSGAVVVAGDPEGVGGSWYSEETGVGEGGWYYDGWQGAYTFKAGVAYVCRAYVSVSNGNGRARFGNINGGDFTEISHAAGTLTNGVICLEWTPSADTSGVQFSFNRSSGGTIATDNLRAFTGGIAGGDGHIDLVGTSSRATRCDHRHDVHRDRAPTVSDDSAAGYKLGTVWARLDDLTTPTEIVGTWMLVDATDGAAVWLEWPTGPSAAAGLGWFDVTEYGAIGDGATDDTSAIQDAIDAAGTAGGGVVYFRAGVYVIAGALQDTTRSNAQLLLPRRHTTNDEQITIHLLGEVPPQPHDATSTSILIPTTGAILKSTLASGSGTAPCVLGGWGTSGSFADLSMTHVKVENLTVRTVTNPSYTAIDLSHMAAAELYNVRADTGQSPISSVTEPTTSTSYGIRFPHLDNGGFNYGHAALVLGFYNGFEFNELAIGNQLSAWGCKQAFVLTDANHASHFGRLMAIWCERGMVFTGEHYVEVEQFDIEHATSGWYETIYDIDDAANNGKGRLTYHVVLAGTGPDATFTKNGGTGIATTRLGDNSSSVSDHGALTGLGDDDHTQYQKESEKSAANGYASLDGTTKVPIAELPTGDTSTTVAVGNHTHTSEDVTDHIHVIGEPGLDGDGSAVTWLLINEAEAESVAAYVNGTRRFDISLNAAGDTVTFDVAPGAGQSVYFDYIAEEA